MHGKFYSYLEVDQQTRQKEFSSRFFSRVRKFSLFITALKHTNTVERVIMFFHFFSELLAVATALWSRKLNKIGNRVVM